MLKSDDVIMETLESIRSRMQSCVTKIMYLN